MEKKLTNSGPLRKPADKHSIYAIKIEIKYSNTLLVLVRPLWRHGFV
jgi:hypothetical protein